ncbi:lipid A biosynthesis lauroyl acyltransferase [Pseudonocardia sulfidoxydans NBRC 16205]|uniref:Lipid A biosynthesis lauroyl acyltransferase n=1 Tax=Pseudonocardia sulfidoxydans NBRC 16205 TaxID=1223511 RepID=A0A511DAN2_9PSEU|nr:phosphatidylinositol mannoside acyltransferase [Pseudonocardia sulfidoxydans]GEL21866.1 lipid A biosynthesis lauroyl acyltransferase [Pseudonocardia sulfidoxydans NBRC 16205]
MTASGERLANLAYGAGWGVVKALPGGVASRIFDTAGVLAARRAGPGVLRLRANLARVVPDAGPAELDALVRDGMRSYARYWCEAFRLPVMDPAAIVTGTAGTGLEPALEAMRAGRGVVLALPHSGNWDAAGVWVIEIMRRAGLHPGFSTVVERLRPAAVYERFVGYRESLGFEVFASDDGAAAYRGLVARLRAGGLVCLVADRDLSAAGVDVTLLGERARMPAGPARLAAMTGALLMPAHTSFDGRGWRIDVGDAIDVAGRAAVPAATQTLADAFTAGIRTSPQDWHMLQPVFTTDAPDPVGVA